MQAAPDSTPEKPSPKQSGLRWFIGSTQLVDLADLSIVITDQGMILQTMLSATITLAGSANNFKSKIPDMVHMNKRCI